MSGLHNVLFPTDISYGARGGPGFSTAIIVTDAGVEERVGRWSRPRRKWDVAYGIKTQEQVQAVRDFYVARYGPLHSFRFRAPTDFSTGAAVTDESYPTSDGHTNADVLIGTGDGATTDFQLRKGYSSGLSTVYVDLKLIVTGSVKVSIDAVDQPSGWTVNETTGVLTFGTAPNVGEVIRAGCEFDIECRFGEELDDHLPLTSDSFSTGSITSIPVVEVIDGSIVAEDYIYPGGQQIAFSSDITWTPLLGNVIHLLPAGAGLTVFVPLASTLETGGPHFRFINGGSDDVEIETSGGSIGTLAAGAWGFGVIFLVAPTTHEWRVLTT